MRLRPTARIFFPPISTSPLSKSPTPGSKLSTIPPFSRMRWLGSRSARFNWSSVAVVAAATASPASNGTEAPVKSPAPAPISPRRESPAPSRRISRISVGLASPARESSIISSSSRSHRTLAANHVKGSLTHRVRIRVRRDCIDNGTCTIANANLRCLWTSVRSDLRRALQVAGDDPATARRCRRCVHGDGANHPFRLALELRPRLHLCAVEYDRVVEPAAPHPEARDCAQKPDAHLGGSVGISVHVALLAENTETVHSRLVEQLRPDNPLA